MATFGEDLRDLINAHYAAGTSENEVVQALATAEKPQAVAAIRAAANASTDVGDDEPLEHDEDEEV